MKLTLIALVLAFVGAVPADAQTRSERAADAISWGTAITSVALDTRTSWQASDRRHAFIRQGERMAFVYGAVFAAKLIVHRDRPCAPSACGADNPHFSFFSGHTAIAFSAVGGPRLEIVIPLGAATGAGRIAARKHYPTDVIVGAGVGWLAGRLIR